MTVGNDIVDLRDPESALTSLHPRYLGRVFTAGERQELAAHPGRLELWTRWAAKEAAFKALAGERAAEHKGLVFSPSAFVTTLDPPGAESIRYGWVTHEHEGVRLAVRVHCSDGTVHAIAATAGELDCDYVAAAVFRLDDGGTDRASLAVRCAARHELAGLLGCDEGRIQVRGRRPPRFFIDEQQAAMSLSLSHHGSWAAFAFSRDRGCDPAQAARRGAVA